MGRKIWVIDKTCMSCNTCAPHCPMEAIVRVNGRPNQYQVHPDKCIVCDLCHASLTCPIESFKCIDYEQRHRYL